MPKRVPKVPAEGTVLRRSARKRPVTPDAAPLSSPYFSPPPPSPEKRPKKTPPEETPKTKTPKKTTQKKKKKAKPPVKKRSAKAAEKEEEIPKVEPEPETDKEEADRDDAPKAVTAEVDPKPPPPSPETECAPGPSSQTNDLGSSSEDEWEEVENLDEDEPAPGNGDIEIILRPSQLRTKKQSDAHAELRRVVARARKAVLVSMHKVQLLCFVSHGLRLSRLGNCETAQALALSLLPSGFAAVAPEMLDASILARLVKWFCSAFQPSAAPECAYEAMTILVTLLRGLTLETRLLFDPSPLSTKDPTEKATKSPPKGAKASSSPTKAAKKPPPPPRRSGEAQANLHYWVEVFLPTQERWLSVETDRAGSVDSPRLVEAACHAPLLYALGFDADGGVRDLTARYAGGWLDSQVRSRRVDPKWWTGTLRLFRGQSAGRDRREDVQMHDELLAQPLPATLAELKNHPLYVVRRHLRKAEALYPVDVAGVGLVRGEPVFPRSAVHTLKAKEAWIKEARVIRIGETAWKTVTARRKPRPKAFDDRLAEEAEAPRPLPLFGFWQTEPYVARPPVDGIIPRNDFGNVDMFQPSMLPPGTVHLHLPGLLPVAKRLGIDAAPAMIGWEFRGRKTFPLFDGFIVCAESAEALLDAWDAAEAGKVNKSSSISGKPQSSQEEKAETRKSQRALRNWRRLAKGLQIRMRVQAKYLPMKDGESSSSSQPAWPPNSHDFSHLSDKIN